MEYPGSKFTKIWRKIIFTLFIVIFFIVSPLIVAYTIGYRWQNGLIKETGAMSIDILPKKATVYINEQKIKDAMPIRLNSITPNSYNIHITAPGYYDWYKDVEVRNKQTVYIKEIELVKKNKPSLLSAAPSHGLYLSPNGDYLIYHQDQNQNTELRIRNTQTNTDTLVETLSLKKEKLISWSHDSQYFVVYEALPTHLFTLRTVLRPQESLYLFEEQNVPIQKFQWLENNTTSELHFATSSSNIEMYNPLTKELKTILNADYLDWYSTPTNFFLLEANTTTERIDLVRIPLNGQKKQLLSLAGDQFLLNNPSAHTWKIDKVLTNDSVLLHNPTKASSYLVTPSSKFNLTTSRSLTSDYNNWLLLWNAWELWGYSAGENPGLLNRSGDQLQSVFPLDKYNTLLLVWDKKSSIFFPYYRVMHDFITDGFETVQVDSKHRAIYFTNQDAQKKGLWKVTY